MPLTLGRGDSGRSWLSGRIGARSRGVGRACWAVDQWRVCGPPTPTPWKSATNPVTIRPSHDRCKPRRSMTAEPTAPSSGPLGGLRVVEIGRRIVAPIAGMVPAEQGAEVIRIVDRSAKSDDPVRDALLARGKIETLLDLDRDDDRDRVLRLLSDVVVENLAPGSRCDRNGQQSLGGQRRFPGSVPFFHETGDYTPGGILFVLLCPNDGDLKTRRRMCTDFWRWREPRGKRRASDTTNLRFHELLYAQFGLRQDQVVTMNAVLCAPRSGSDSARPLSKPDHMQTARCVNGGEGGAGSLASRVAALDSQVVVALGKDAAMMLQSVGTQAPVAASGAGAPGRGPGRRAGLGRVVASSSLHIPRQELRVRKETNAPPRIPSSGHLRPMPQSCNPRRRLRLRLRLHSVGSAESDPNLGAI